MARSSNNHVKYYKFSTREKKIFKEKAQKVKEVESYK
jgi:hypothetical protein